MKVALDISILGSEVLSPQNQTGIYKAIEALATNLIKLKESSQVEDFELATFSSDLEQLHGSKLAWEMLLERLQLPPSRYPFLEGSKLNVWQQIALNLSEAKKNKKIKRQPHLKESVLLAIMRPFFKQAKKFWKPLIAPNTVVHIPFTRDLDKFPPQAGLARVVTCYDLTPILCKARAEDNPKESQKFAGRLRLIQADDFVCCISHSAKHDLLNFNPQLTAANLVVTHLAAEPNKFSCVTDALSLAAVKQRCNIPNNAYYMLSVCTHLPHKNMPFLIRNFLELCVKKSITDDVVLVLCGGKRKFTAEMEALLLQCPQYSHRVIVTGYVADEDLPALYSGATAFVLPSLYEGFGLPILEAMQCGTPVLCSNTASLPEVGGDAAIYASPTDDAQFQQQIVALLNSPELRREMVEKGFEQAKKFSWEQSAQETLAVYRQAYESLLAGIPT